MPATPRASPVNAQQQQQQQQQQPPRSRQGVTPERIMDAMRKADEARKQALDQGHEERAREHEQSAQRMANMLEQMHPELADRGRHRPGLDMIEPPREQPGFGEQVAREVTSRPATVGAGAMAGAGIGAKTGTAFAPVTGPVGPLVGSVVGGAIGAGAGSAAFDSIRNIKAALEDNPEDVLGAIETSKRALKESQYDAMFGLGGALAQPVRFGRRLLNRWSGLTTKESQALQKKAKDLGIGVGAIDVGGALPRGYGKSVGVFPVTGSPLRREEIKKVGDIDRAVERIANTMAPNYHTSQAIGTDMFDAAMKQSRKFTQVQNNLYKTARKQITQAAEASGRHDIIPTENVKKYADAVEESLRQGDITLLDGSALPRAANQEAMDFVTKLRELPDTITLEQFERLKRRDLSKLMSKHAKDNVDVGYLAATKGALEQDFRNMRLEAFPEHEASRIRNTLKVADNFHAKGQTLFSKPAAQKMTRVDKTIYRAGAEQPGSLNADEIYHTAINLRSPDQIRDLTELVGKKNMQNAVRYHFETAVQNARQTEQIMGMNFDVINPQSLERQLGVYGAKSHQREGVKELYKQAGVNFKQVEDLISVINRLEHIGNAAEFVRRRAILGGVAAGGAAVAGAGGAVATAGIPGGAVTLGAMTMLSRHYSKIFASPEKLRLMQTALDESIKAGPRRAAYSRLIKAFADQPDDDSLIQREMQLRQAGRETEDPGRIHDPDRSYPEQHREDPPEPTEKERVYPRWDIDLTKPGARKSSMGKKNNR